MWECATPAKGLVDSSLILPKNRGKDLLSLVSLGKLYQARGHSNFIPIYADFYKEKTSVSLTPALTDCSVNEPALLNKNSLLWLGCRVSVVSLKAIAWCRNQNSKLDQSLSVVHGNTLKFLDLGAVLCFCHHSKLALLERKSFLSEQRRDIKAHFTWDVKKGKKTWQGGDIFEC